MAKSTKPLVWGPFAAGGTVTAFVTPVLMLLTLLAGLDYVPEILIYENMHAFVGNWLVKIALVGIIFLSLWSAAHRLRITIYDCRVRADTLVAWVVYAIAIAGTLAAACYVAQI